jgi:acyl carrier protein
MHNKLIKILEEILEEDNIQLNFELNDENWDSLNIISFIAAIHSNFQIVLEAEKISEVTNVGDLINLVERA